MKKLTLIFFCILISATLLSLMSGVSAVENEVTVVLDGEALTFDVPGRIIGDRTMVPVRGIFEALNAEVNWVADTREVISKRGDDTIKLAIGSSELYKNGELAYTMDVPAMIIEEAGQSRTLVPVRAVAEAYNCLVDWDGDTRTAIITTTDNGVILADADGTDYKIVYESALENALLGDINTGANILRYDIGQNMKIEPDTASTPVSVANEIVIGNTNRPGNEEFAKTLSPGEYAIRFDPASRRVFIFGGSTEDTINAINYFFNTYADKENKVFAVPYDLDYKLETAIYSDDYAIFYGQELLDAIQTKNTKKGELVYEFDTKKTFSKFVGNTGSSPEIYFTQNNSQTNIFEYSHYVVRYYNSQQTKNLDTCLVANVNSVKKLYPDFTMGWYERWGDSHPAASNGVWKTAVVARDDFNNDPANAMPHPDITDQKLRFKAWSGTTAEADSYFALEYIALFKNEADAKAFVRSIEKHEYSNVAATSLALVQDGKEVTAAETLINNPLSIKVVVTPANASINVEAKSDNTNVIDIVNGTFNAKSEGTANLTFTANKGIEGAEIITKTVAITVTGYKFDSIMINGVDMKNYKIVIPADCDLSTKYAAYNLADYMTVNAGYTPEVITDAESESENEILVGKTNRAESAINISLKDTEYVLMQSGNKIVMQGSGIYVGSAVGAFINTFLESQGEIANVTSLPTTAMAKSTPDFGDDYDNVILMIGDGMGYNHVNSSLRNGLDKFVAQDLPIYGSQISRSYSVIADGAGYTDSAAAATALATGYKTQNGRLGYDHNMVKVKNVRELAQEYGAQTAVVTNDAITGATPGGFLVHNKSRGNTVEIQAEIDMLVNNDLVDFVAGSVGDRLTEVSREALRTINDTESPFFIMIEETATDGAGHNNNMPKLISATTRFNDAIAYAIQFVLCNPDTALIISADHETGGVTEDATSEYGYKFTTTSHTNVNVPVYAIGPGTDVFDDTATENIDIARFIAKAYGADSFGQTWEVPAVPAA
ncbi:MAG: alkaline phosphatase [Clostridia bacterium]|nr:alkaline phosphatase [Clostridia bacterium]